MRTDIKSVNIFVSKTVAVSLTPARLELIELQCHDTSRLVHKLTGAS